MVSSRCTWSDRRADRVDSRNASSDAPSGSQAQTQREKLSARRVIECVTKILNQHKSAHYLTYEAAPGMLSFRLDRPRVPAAALRAT
jgi:hypothetical protein